MDRLSDRVDDEANDQATVQYVHVLLFECPQCGEPVVFAQLTASRNLEEVDADTASYSCKCGHVGVLLGLRARQHWVEEWYRNDPGGAGQGGTGLTFS